MRLSAPIRNSLAIRLALVYGLISLGLVASLGLGVYFLTARYLDAQVKGELSALADFYAAYTAATAPSEAERVALAPQIVSFFAPQAGYDVRLFNTRNGTLLAATPTGANIGPLPSSAALAELRYRRPTLFLAASQDLPGRRYAARPVVAADGTIQAVVEVSRDVGEAQAFLDTLRLVLIGAGAVALAAALAASLLLARHVTRPLHTVEAATRAIASGDFSRRLPVTSADEVGRLMASVNQMAADLARLESARREFIAKVSHDLRTPLTAIKGTIVNLQDAAPREMAMAEASLATMDEQADRLIRLVDDLLTASRLQRGELRLNQAATDLAAVARSAAAIVDLKAKRMGVTLTLDLPGDLPPVRGDGDRLQQVIVNLLDNAVRASPPGSTICLAIAPYSRAEGGELIATVVDSGPGLAPPMERQAFEPYVHGPGGGAGLGLTIAREVVAAHGGRIWLKNRPEGGAEAGFALPIR
jgi:two-component system, OmpR family, sensor kinase